MLYDDDIGKIYQIVRQVVAEELAKYDATNAAKVAKQEETIRPVDEVEEKKIKDK